MTEWFFHELLKKPLTWEQAIRLSADITDWCQTFTPEKVYSGRESLRDEGSVVRKQFGIKW